jgi:hypothetical protein
MDKLVKIAVGGLGQKEIHGTGNNLAIAGYGKETGFS